jgi:hypothetical protein
MKNLSLFFISFFTLPPGLARGRNVDANPDRRAYISARDVSFAKFLFLPSWFAKLLEQLQQFGNQLGIHLILAKREKLPSNSLANQLGKNRNLAKLTSSRAYIRARIVVASGISL